VENVSSKLLLFLMGRGGGRKKPRLVMGLAGDVGLLIVNLVEAFGGQLGLPLICDGRVEV